MSKSKEAEVIASAPLCTFPVPIPLIGLTGNIQWITVLGEQDPKELTRTICRFDGVRRRGGEVGLPRADYVGCLQQLAAVEPVQHHLTRIAAGRLGHSADG